MARYFFHLRDGEDLLLDPEGRDLQSLESIAAVALYEARAIIGDEARSGRIQFDKRIDVEDEFGTVVHRLPFADAVKLVY